MICKICGIQAATLKLNSIHCRWIMLRNHPRKYTMDYATKIIEYRLPRKIIQLVLSLFQVSSMKGVITFPIILFPWMQTECNRGKLSATKYSYPCEIYKVMWSCGYRISLHLKDPFLKFHLLCCILHNLYFFFKIVINQILSVTCAPCFARRRQDGD